MNKPAFIIGNGLSIALSPEFALKRITEKFISSLSGSDKDFFIDICNSTGKTFNFDDFEESFTAIEAALDNLIKYNKFVESKTGKKFLDKYKMIDPKLGEHVEIIQRIYKSYIGQVLELIHGNVHVDQIQNKIKPFVEFLLSKIEKAESAYIFTLNYDLLVETIILQNIGTDIFTDFCFPSGLLHGTSILKFDFNPNRSREWFDSPERKVELHHLHGSLSLFYDYGRNRAVKLRSDDIGIEGIYKKISDDKLPLIPAIITGGGKSEKIVQYPFDFYYRAIKDICDSGEASQLFVVGYSFRDDHVNDLIERWMDNVEDYKKGLRIIDFKKTNVDQDNFKDFVRGKIRKRPKIDDICFQFNGVNNIIDCAGTQKKVKKLK